MVDAPTPTPAPVPTTVEKVVAVATPVAEAARNKLIAFVSAHPKTACVIMVAEAVAILVLKVKGSL